MWRALTVARPRVRYAVVPGAVTNWLAPRLLPRRVVDRLIARRFGLSLSGG